MSMSFRDMLYPENNEQSSPSRSPKRTSYIRSPSRLQDPVDTDNEIKAQQLAKMYEKRLEILKESLEDAFGIVKSDNLVDTMKNDVSTAEYAYERVKQIIEKCMNDDKEALVDKLCQENANLKSECFKLDQENLKIAKQYEDRIEDLTKKLSELREKHVSEQKNKEGADDQVKNLQHLVENLRHSNEEALRKKEDQITNLKQEVQELSMYREQTEKLEDLLQENEDKYKRLQHEHNQLQKEAITLRSRHKEHDNNIDSLNSIIDDMQRIIDESQAVLKERQKTEHDLKFQLETLTEKNEKLEASLVALNSHEKLLKDEFNYKIEKIETGILNERSEQEKASATLENKYKKKLKQKRDKIYSYKERLAEKDKKLEEVENHFREIFERHENEKEDIRQSFEGQKNIYEQKMLEIEEECAKRIEEINRRNYQEAMEVQEKFEKLLEKIMRQAQEEANHKIDQITEEAKKATQILRQKEDEIRREYIKIEYHEKLMVEKANLVDHMKHEWVNREGQITHEAELRLKEQREKITDDFNIQIAILKNGMTDLERQLHHQQAQKRETEKEVDFLKETNQNLKTIIKELEFEKEKTFENIDEWSIKMEKLREAYEEEERKTAELRQLLNEESRNNEETNKHLNTACEEIAKKDMNLASVIEELQHLETKYSQIQSEHRQLESEHQILRKESSNKMNEQEIKINSLNEENRTFKEDNKKLKDRIAELTEEFEAKWQKANSSQNEMSLKLRKEEDQAKTLDFDVKLLQKQIAELEQNLSESERQKKEFSNENVRLKSEVNELAQEKEKIQSREQKVSTKLYLLKKQIESFASSKVGSIRTELADLKKFYNDSFNLYVKEVELKIQSLVNSYNLIQRRKNDEYIRNIEAIELRLKSEAQSLIEKNITKNKQMQKDLVESYEYKCLEKDRQIKTVENACEQLRDQNQRLQKDLQSITTECNAVKEEYKNNELEVVALSQELNDKEQYFEKTKKMLLKEIDDKVRESAKEQTEFVKERKSLKERYTKEIEDMKSQMESLKHKHVSSMSSYEQRMSSISLQQFEKAEELENNYKDSIQRLQITLDDTLLRKEKLNKEAELLREKNYNLEKKALDLERAKSHIESLYQKNCVEYEETIEMLQEGRSKENLKVRELRTVSKEDDINYLRALSQLDREGAKSAREISDLTRENEQLEQQLASLEGRIGANNKFILAKRDKLRNNPLQNYQLKETRTQGMLSPLLTSPLESPYNNQYRRTTIGNSALNYISPRLNTDYELQFASKTPKTKSYFLDQGLDRKIYSERGTLYSDYDTKGLK